MITSGGVSDVVEVCTRAHAVATSCIRRPIQPDLAIVATGPNRFHWLGGGLSQFVLQRRLFSFVK